MSAEDLNNLTPPQTQEQLQETGNPSLIGTPPNAGAADWKEYTPDPAKSEADNATAKAAHDATKPAPAPAAETPEAKAAREAAIAPVDFGKLKVPDGFTIDETISKEFTEIVNDDKLSRADRAQKLIDLQAKFFGNAATARSEAWNTLQTDWQKNVQSDPEVGGEKLAGHLQSISTLIDSYGSPALREIFTTTGAGNHVEMVKFLTKIAAKLNEGGPISGSPGNADGGAKTLYDKTPSLT